MNRPDHPWQKLVALARQAPAEERDLSLPLGFATRLSALAARGPAATPWSGLERFAVRGFVAAAACCAATLAYSYFGPPSDLADEAALEDTVAEFVALS